MFQCPTPPPQQNICFVYRSLSKIDVKTCSFHSGYMHKVLIDTNSQNCNPKISTSRMKSFVIYLDIKIQVGTLHVSLA